MSICEYGTLCGFLFASFARGILTHVFERAHLTADRSSAIVQVFAKLIVARCIVGLIIGFPFKGDRAVLYCNYPARLPIRKSANYYTKARAVGIRCHLLVS